MRVLHLVATMGYGGIERWLLSMLEEIDRKEVAIDVCCRSSDAGPLAPKARAQGADVSLCPLTPEHVRFARCLEKRLRSGGYDVLHSHVGTYSGIAAWVGRRANVPVITTFHNTEFPSKGWTRYPGLRQARGAYSELSVRYAMRNSTLVTGVSQAVLDALPDLSGRAAACEVLRLGVEIPDLPTDEERALVRTTEGWPATTPLLIHVGRFVAQKNHAAVVKVFEKVSEAMPSARMLLVGDGPLRAGVERQVRQQGLSDRVHLLGQREDAARLIAASDVVLLPSRHEGFPLVALEASAAGVPVVGTKIASLAEAVVDGEGGMLLPEGDIHGMASATLDLLCDTGRARSMGFAGRNRVESTNTRALAANALVDMYRRTLQ